MRRSVHRMNAVWRGVLLSAGLLSGSLGAQESAPNAVDSAQDQPPPAPVVEPEPAPPTLYDVDVLVFEHLDRRDSLYRWRGEPSLARALDILPALPDFAPSTPAFGDSAPPSADEDIAEPPAFITLLESSEERGLIDAFRRLQRHGSYRTIVLQSWRQPLLPGRGQAIRVRNERLIHQPSVDPETLVISEPILELDGHVTFEQRRFKHVRIDLALRETAPQRTVMDPWTSPVESAPQSLLGNVEEPADALLSSPLENADTMRTAADEPTLAWRSYRLSGSQQVRPGQTLYFDHQRLGAIVRVTLAPEVDPPTDQVVSPTDQREGEPFATSGQFESAVR